MFSYLQLNPVDYSQKINHLRGIGALWIFVFHFYHFIAGHFFTPLNSLNPFLLLVYHGYFCVYLFFILSAYLLAKSYTKKLNLTSFFGKRVIRIFPAYYLCVILYCLLFTRQLPDLKLFTYIFSTDLGVYPGPLGHLWFINRLLECYLSFPLLWWVQQKYGPIGLFMLYMLCLLGGGYWVLNHKVSLPDYYFSFILCFSHFTLGMLAAQVTFINRHIGYVLCMTLLFAGILTGFHHYTWQVPLGHSWMSIVWLNYISFMLVALIQSYLSSQAVCLPKLISQFMQIMGKISYPFYLVHFPVIHFFIVHHNYLTSYTSLNFLIVFFSSVSSACLMQKLLTFIR